MIQSPSQDSAQEHRGLLGGYTGSKLTGALCFAEVLHDIIYCVCLLFSVLLRKEERRTAKAATVELQHNAC